MKLRITIALCLLALAGCNTFADPNPEQGKADTGVGDAGTVDADSNADSGPEPDADDSDMPDAGPSIDWSIGETRLPVLAVDDVRMLSTATLLELPAGTSSAEDAAIVASLAGEGFFVVALPDETSRLRLFRISSADRQVVEMTGDVAIEVRDDRRVDVSMAEVGGQIVVTGVTAQETLYVVQCSIVDAACRAHSKPSGTDLATVSVRDSEFVVYTYGEMSGREISERPVLIEDDLSIGPAAELLATGPVDMDMLRVREATTDELVVYFSGAENQYGFIRPGVGSVWILDSTGTSSPDFDIAGPPRIEFDYDRDEASVLTDDDQGGISLLDFFLVVPSGQIWNYSMSAEFQAIADLRRIPLQSGYLQMVIDDNSSLTFTAFDGLRTSGTTAGISGIPGPAKFGFVEEQFAVLFHLSPDNASVQFYEFMP